MQHLTIGIFGNADFMKQVAKQGTVNDLMIYNHASSDGVLTYVAPSSGEKIQPLLQAINLADVPVIVCDEITKELAEQIIAIDAFGFSHGFICSASDDIKKIVRGTSLDRFECIEERDLREKLKTIAAQPLTGGAWAPVDNYFNVKSVGTVVLSVIKGGTIRKHDKLIVQPLGTEVMVKGIQSQDKDIESASCGMRAGLNLKGIEADELKRGFVLCADALIKKQVTLQFTKNRYAKEAMEEGAQVFLSVGLQVIPGRIDNAGGMHITLEHPAVYFSGQKCLLASTKAAMPRILGTGVLA